MRKQKVAYAAQTQKRVLFAIELFNWYLYLLETVGHHSYEHINENNDGHDVVGHEEALAHSLYEPMLLL